MNVNEHDIKFFVPTAPHGLLTSFFWPEQDGICTVRYNQIICPTNTHSTSQNEQIYGTNFPDKS